MQWHSCSSVPRGKAGEMQGRCAQRGVWANQQVQTSSKARHASTALQLPDQVGPHAGNGIPNCCEVLAQWRLRQGAATLPPACPPASTSAARTALRPHGYAGSRWCVPPQGCGSHLALAHGDARAVPEALLRLRLFVVIVAAGAQRRAQLVLVLCKPLDDHCRHRLVHAEVGARPAWRHGWVGVRHSMHGAASESGQAASAGRPAPPLRTWPHTARRTCA